MGRLVLNVLLCALIGLGLAYVILFWAALKSVGVL